MDAPELPGTLRDELRASWHRYLDLVAPLRPALHGYCRKLTGDLWDAEDLVQDTLVRAFGRLGHIHHEIRSPRAYLFRTATNVWIDAVRRRGSETSALAAHAAEQEPPRVPESAGAVRDAGAALMQRLAPQERAAVVLKDAFDMNLEEIADVLETTVGAVKAALHRGRARLRDCEGGAPPRRPVPSKAVVDRFVALWDAKDMPGLVSLMLDSGSIENVGCGVEFGREAFESKGGWFHHALYGHPEWPPPFAYESARVEERVVDGEPMVLGFATRRGREALETAIRFEEQDGRIARIRGYAFCPETMRELGEKLGLPVRTGLYRYPTKAPGVAYDGDAG